MHFSSRIQDPRLQNRLTRVHERLVSKGVTCVDLTVSNPTRVGFRYPEQLLDELAAVRGLRYDPEPLGLSSARGEWGGLPASAGSRRRRVASRPDREYERCLLAAVQAPV